MSRALGWCVIGAVSCAAPQRLDDPAAVYRRYQALVAAHQDEQARALLLTPSQPLTAPNTDGPARIDAVLHAGADDVVLRLVDGHWRIAHLPEWYRQDEPVAALRSFARAVQDGRYDVVYNFVPPPWRSRTTPDQLRAAWQNNRELSAELAALEASLPTARVTRSDHHADVHWADHSARLVEASGVWTVERLQ